MRSILAILAGMLLCSSVSATTLDSTISGVYLAPDRVCNMVVSRPPLLWDGAPQLWWVTFDLKCLTFSGQFRASRVLVLYVYTACPMFGSTGVIVDDSAAPSEFTSIRSGNAQSLQVIRSNDPTQAANGIGTAQTWLRVVPLASPYPYVCSTYAVKPGR